MVENTERAIETILQAALPDVHYIRVRMFEFQPTLQTTINIDHRLRLGVAFDNPGTQHVVERFADAAADAGLEFNIHRTQQAKKATKKKVTKSPGVNPDDAGDDEPDLTTE